MPKSFKFRPPHVEAPPMNGFFKHALTVQSSGGLHIGGDNWMTVIPPAIAPPLPPLVIVTPVPGRDGGEGSECCRGACAGCALWVGWFFPRNCAISSGVHPAPSKSKPSTAPKKAALPAIQDLVFMPAQCAESWIRHKRLVKFAICHLPSSAIGYWLSAIRNCHGRKIRSQFRCVCPGDRRFAY